MAAYPRCGVDPRIVREAGVRAACYELQGNLPARWRSGQIFTIDPKSQGAEDAISEARIPYERLHPGPTGKLFMVDARDFGSSLTRANVDLDRPGRFVFDQGDPETHCRNAYFAAMETYEAFRRALGRPVAWAFWDRDRTPPLRLVPFGVGTLNAWYEREAGEVRFGYAPFADTGQRGDDRLLRFTALSTDVVAHEITHALLDGLRPGFDLPVHPDVPAFHESIADLVALLSRFQRKGFLARLLLDSGPAILDDRSLTSLAPELGRPLRRLGLRTLEVDWLGADPDDAGAAMPLYRDAPDEPHERGALLSSAVFEAFLRVLDRRIRPLRRLAGREQGPVMQFLLGEIEKIAVRTAAHFLSICIRAVDYCPPAAIRFDDYLRALITADRLLVRDDRFFYRDAFIDAFRRRGIYPPHIDVRSEQELEWDEPDVRVEAIPGLALSELRFSGTPTLPLSAAEVERQARALALAIDADPRFYRALGLRDPAIAAAGETIGPPMVTSIRPTIRTGPDGYVDASVIAEIVQTRESPMEGSLVVQRGGATLIIDSTGVPSRIVSQRIDNGERLEQERAHLRRAIAAGHLVPRGGRYVVSPERRRSLC